MSHSRRFLLLFLGLLSASAALLIVAFVLLHRSGAEHRILMTQEGKYHYDGHRSCGISWSPDQSIAADNVCPVCGKELTIGVLHRVEDLADRTEPELGGVPFRSLIPLAKIISQAVGVGVNCKAVAKICDAMLDRHGTELDILLERSLDDISVGTPDRVLEGIAKMQSGNIHIEPGYDGVFGKVEIPFESQA